MKQGGLAVVVILALGLMAVGTLHAHSGATGIVKERMEVMKSVRADTKALAKMIKGEKVYDPDAVARLAARIGTHGGESMRGLFPEGSNTGVSEAKAEIWSDWERFLKIADDMAAAAQALSTAAHQGPDAVRPLLATLAGTCKACHDDFRERK